MRKDQRRGVIFIFKVQLGLPPCPFSDLFIRSYAARRCRRTLIRKPERTFAYTMFVLSIGGINEPTRYHFEDITVATIIYYYYYNNALETKTGEFTSVVAV